MKAVFGVLAFPSVPVLRISEISTPSSVEFGNCIVCSASKMQEENFVKLSSSCQVDKDTESRFCFVSSSSPQTQVHCDDQHENDKSREDSEEIADSPVPPDGGWGWLIVLASFLCNFIVDGISYSFGIFLMEIVRYYDAPKGKVAWAGSLLTGFNQCIGPLASALTNRFGCRAVTIIGSIVAFIGFLLSSQAPSMNVLMITYGIIGGTGFGLISLPAAVSAGYYFTSKRALATGIAATGSGLGSILFAPFCGMLLETYGWNSTMIIFSGLSLSCIVFGALMIPLAARKHRKLPLQKTSEENEEEKHCGSCSSDIQNADIIDESQSQFAQKFEPVVPSISKITSPENTNFTISEKAEGQDIQKMVTPSINDQIPNGVLNSCLYKQSNGDVRSCVAIVIPDPIDKIDIREIMTDSNQKLQHQERSYFFKLLKNMMDTISNVLDFSLMKNKVFLLICLADIVGMVGFDVPYSYITDSSVLKGISLDSATFLLCVIGISNTPGRVFFGWLSDRPGVSALLLYNISVAMTGVCVFCVPFCSTYAIVAVDCTLFGLFASAYVCLTPVILVELLGLDQLTNAFGLVSLFRGVSSTVGPPMAGFLHDMTGSYDIPFYTAGGLIVLSSALSFMVQFVAKKYNKNKGNLKQEAASEGNQDVIRDVQDDVV